MRKYLLGLLLVASPAFGGESGPLPDWVMKSKIGGEVFVDGYAMLANHNEAIEDANGFWFTRIRLTVDSKLNESFSTRVRLEVESPGDFSTSKAALDPYIKDAALNWNHGVHTLFLGLSEAPAWAVIEKTWGYRSILKTPLDLQKIGESRDIGIGYKAKAADGKVAIHLMVGNGNDRKEESNEGKKVYGALTLRPNKTWIIEGYADFDSRPGDTDRTTLQGFVAAVGKTGRIGAQYSHQNRDGGDDLDIDVVSAFGVLKVSDKVSLLARFDGMLDPNPDGAKIAYLPFDPTAKSKLFFVGTDIGIGPSISVIPTVAYVSYDLPDGVAGDDPDDDILARVTVAWSF